MHKNVILFTMKQRAAALRSAVAENRDRYTATSLDLMRREASTWERAADLVAKIDDLSVDLANALQRILGKDPDRFGYGAAHNALNDEIRAEAHAALNRARVSRLECDCGRIGCGECLPQ